MQLSGSVQDWEHGLQLPVRARLLRAERLQGVVSRDLGARKELSLGPSF